MSEIGPGNLILLMVLQGAVLYLLIGTLHLARGVRYFPFLAVSSAVLAVLYAVGVGWSLVFAGLQWTTREAGAWTVKMLLILLGFLVVNGIICTTLYVVFRGVGLATARKTRASKSEEEAWGSTGEAPPPEAAPTAREEKKKPTEPVEEIAKPWGDS